MIAVCRWPIRVCSALFCVVFITGVSFQGCSGAALQSVQDEYGEVAKTPPLLRTPDGWPMYYLVEDGMIEVPAGGHVGHDDNPAGIVLDCIYMDYDSDFFDAEDREICSMAVAEAVAEVERRWKRLYVACGDEPLGETRVADVGPSRWGLVAKITGRLVRAPAQGSLCLASPDKKWLGVTLAGGGRDFDGDGIADEINDRRGTGQYEDLPEMGEVWLHLSTGDSLLLGQWLGG